MRKRYSGLSGHLWLFAGHRSYLHITGKFSLKGRIVRYDIDLNVFQGVGFVPHHQMTRSVSILLGCLSPYSHLRTMSSVSTVNSNWRTREL